MRKPYLYDYMSPEDRRAYDEHVKQENYKLAVSLLRCAFTPAVFYVIDRHNLTTEQQKKARQQMMAQGKFTDLDNVMAKVLRRIDQGEQINDAMEAVKHEIFALRDQAVVSVKDILGIK